MKMKIKIMNLDAGGKSIGIINHKDAMTLGVHPLDRIVIKKGKRKATITVDTTKNFVKQGTVVVYNDVKALMNLKSGDTVDAEPRKILLSKAYIRKKTDGQELNYEELREIVDDVIARNLNDLEMASFVTALHIHGLTMNESMAMSKAMIATGKKVKFTGTVVDKHCLPEDIPVIVKNSGETKVENIGEIIDSIFETCSPSDITKDEVSEFTDRNLKNLHVLTHDNDGNVKFVPTSGVFRVKSPKYLEEIELIGNRKLRCTREHTIFVLKKGNIVNIPAGLIKVGDYVLVPSGFSNNNKIEEISLENFKTGKRNYRNFPNKIKITKEFMRLIGYYISEGFTNYQGVFLNFGSHEKDLIEDSIKCIETVFGFKPTKNYPHPTAIRVCMYSQVLSEVFNKIMKAGNDALNKKIPGFLFDVSDEMKKEFLRALCMGDGHERRGYEEIYVTSSKKLATDIQYFLALLGISASISEIKESKREFNLKSGPYSSKTQKSYYIYTQARELFGGRQKANVSFINLLPIRELGEIDSSEIGWEFRRDLKRQEYMTKQKLSKIIGKIKSNDTKKLITGNLSVLRVKNRNKIESKSKYIYDFKVDGYNRFIAGTGPMCVHNSIGGVPGDKTSILAVPIIASAGLTIPKTSSRSITSPAGTADRMEVLAPVEFDTVGIKRIVKKTGGCLVWGGAVDLAPADDLFIRIEHPLGLDPLLLPSVMSKKKSVGCRYLIIDIPTGSGAKMEKKEDAEKVAASFKALGNKLGIKVECAITRGDQPVGYAIGPALEAREALEAIMGISRSDVIDKATSIAGLLLSMVGKGSKKTAEALIKNGKAEKKLREIIKAQGGNPDIKPENIRVGPYKCAVKSKTAGVVAGISNASLVDICRSAGTPQDHGAGILLNKKINDTVKKGETLFTIYSEKQQKLAAAVKTAKSYEIYDILSGKRKMLVEKL